MSETVIEVKGVSKHFGQFCAVDDLSFSVSSAQCFGFLGPNGAGKTTMMKMVYAVSERDHGTNGRISVFGYDPKDQQLRIKYLCGVVPQEDNLDEELNVSQNLMIYAKFYDIPAGTAGDRIDKLLGFLELSERKNSAIKELSGGMKRRLVIARALINNPKLLLLDEPTTGLDPQVRHLIWDKLRQLKKEGTTILLTTHYMDEAFQLCDRVLIMHKGRKLMQDSPAKLLSSKVEKYVLEVPDADSAGRVSRHPLFGSVRVDAANQTAKLYSDRLEDLRQLAASIEGSHYYLRQANLEDVFLRATGSRLDEHQ